MSKELPNKCQCTSCSGNMVFNTRLQELVCEGCGTRHPVPEYLLISKERAEKTETQIAKSISGKVDNDLINSAYACTNVVDGSAAAVPPL